MLQNDRTLQSIYEATPQDLLPYFHYNYTKTSSFYRELHQSSPTELMLMYKNKGITPVTILDKWYPYLLRTIYDPPWVLYLKGRNSFVTSEKMVSIVGTRIPTRGACEIVSELAGPLIKGGWTVVSGLAYGIDTYAHEAAIQQGGKTIAVLGSGFDYIYPPKNKNLADRIASSHLLLTEYPPTKRPEKWQFPERNRIISGLSLGTLIVEAKEKSGSLITAYQALDQNREVFAVPGSIREPKSKGTNQLIKEGAHLVESGEDILNILLPTLKNSLIHPH